MKTITIKIPLAELAECCLKYPDTSGLPATVSIDVLAYGTSNGSVSLRNVAYCYAEQQTYHLNAIIVRGWHETVIGLMADYIESLERNCDLADLYESEDTL